MRYTIFYFLFFIWQLMTADAALGQRGIGRPVASADKRLALVIGNSNYGSKPLPNASHDAQDIAKTLRSLGFEVILKENLTQEGFENVVSDFTRRLQSYAVGLFYFAGHGFEGTDNINYLMSVDVRSGLNETLTKKKSLSLNDIMGSMKESNSQTNILLVDACRNNPFRSWGRSEQKGLGSLTAPEGTIAFFAASPGEEASENLGGRNGLFTQELLVQLEEPNMELISIFKNTARAVKARNRYQTPYQAGFIMNDFYFRLEAPPMAVTAPNSATPVTSTVTPPSSVASVTPKSQALRNGLTRDLPYGPRMVYVVGGEYQMGSNTGELDEKPMHREQVGNFWIGQTEVSVGQYLSFCEATQAHWPQWLEKGNKYHVETGNDTYYTDMGYSRGAINLPIVGVSWHDATSYCIWLTEKTGMRYRLPTEAEWEYSARGGNLSKGGTYSGGSDVGLLGWIEDNSGGKPHEVGKKKANELGLYDMSGNVWEWCSDWYKGYVGSSGIKDYTNTLRVLRGGSWGAMASSAHVAYRLNGVPGDCNFDDGFRVIIPSQ